MNEIRNLRDIKTETSRLKELSVYQLKQLRYDLKGIKEDFKPGNVLRRILSFARTRNRSGNGTDKV